MIRNAEIKVGQHYLAKIRGQTTCIKIINARTEVLSGRRRFDAINLKTKRSIVLKSGTKLLKEISENLANVWGK